MVVVVVAAAVVVVAAAVATCGGSDAFYWVQFIQFQATRPPFNVCVRCVCTLLAGVGLGRGVLLLGCAAEWL